MRILFIGMTNSIHTTRWIKQLINQNWEIYLFPVDLCHAHPSLEGITVYGSYLQKKTNNDTKVRFIWWTIPLFMLEALFTRFNKSSSYFLSSIALSWVIKWIKPDMIHSLEIQHSGYLTYKAFEMIKKPFPTWIISNWGSDIYLFGRLNQHKPKISRILEVVDYYFCECERDINLAISLGLKGKILPILPNTGGFNFEDTRLLHNKVTPSTRKNILLKGYQHWAGRALFGLQSLRYCTDLLKGYTIVISVSNTEVQIAAELFSQDTGIPIEIIPDVSHEEMMQYYGKSRIYIGLSISDGISTSLLEAMVMGTFPIQSHTACADEWIINGQSGFIVPPEDPYEVSIKIREALKNDFLVDQAARMNLETVKNRLDYYTIQQKVIEIYNTIYREITEAQ